MYQDWSKVAFRGELQCVGFEGEIKSSNDQQTLP